MDVDVRPDGTASNFHQHRTPHRTEENQEGPSNFRPSPPPHRPQDGQAGKAAVPQRSNSAPGYFAPDPDYDVEEATQEKKKRPKSRPPGHGKYRKHFVPLELSVINETMSPELRDSNPKAREAITDFDPVVHVDDPENPNGITKGRKSKKKKDKTKEKALVGVAATTGAMATGMAVTSTTVMATEAAASVTCCASICANCAMVKFVSVAMFAGVVVGVGYAGYSGGRCQI